MFQCEHSFVFFGEWCGIIMQSGYSTCRFTFLLFRWLRKCLSLENTQKKDFLSFNKTSILSVDILSSLINNLDTVNYFCSYISVGGWQVHIAHGGTLNICVFTFSAVCSVVQRRRVSIVVWRYLLRRAPDPVKAIPKGELVPATRSTLKVTLRGWMSRKIRIYLNKVETGSSLLTLETAADTTISVSRWSLLICHGIFIFMSTKYICFCLF